MSLDCSLSDNDVSKAVQRTTLNCALPLIFAALAAPVWCVLFLLHRRSAAKQLQQKQVAGTGTTGAGTGPRAAADGGGSGAEGTAAAPRADVVDGEVASNEMVWSDGSGRRDSYGAGGAPAASSSSSSSTPQAPGRGTSRVIAGTAAAVAEAYQPVPGQQPASAPAVLEPGSPTTTAGRGTGGHGQSAGGGRAALPRLGPYLELRMIVSALAICFYFYPSVTDELLSVLQCVAVDERSGPYAQYTFAVVGAAGEGAGEGEGNHTEVAALQKAACAEASGSRDPCTCLPHAPRPPPPQRPARLAHYGTAGGASMWGRSHALAHML